MAFYTFIHSQAFEGHSSSFQDTQRRKTKRLALKALTVSRRDRQANRQHNTASGTADEEQIWEKVVRKNRRQMEAGRERQETARPRDGG